MKLRLLMGTESVYLWLAGGLLWLSATMYLIFALARRERIKQERMKDLDEKGVNSARSTY